MKTMNKGIHPDTELDLGDGLSMSAKNIRNGMAIMSVSGKDARPRVIEDINTVTPSTQVRLHLSDGKSVTMAPDQEVGVLFSGKRVWIRAAYLYPGMKVFVYTAGFVGNTVVSGVEKLPSSTPMLVPEVRGDQRAFFAGGLLCR